MFNTTRSGTVAHFATDFAPCGCRTHWFTDISCTRVKWHVRDRRYRLRCLSCGKRWSRAVVSWVGTGLNLNAEHPEEQARRAAA
jgi:hypothetical protein